VSAPWPDRSRSSARTPRRSAIPAFQEDPANRRARGCPGKRLAKRRETGPFAGHLDQLLSRRRRLTRGHHAALPFLEVPAFVAQLRDRAGTAGMDSGIPDADRRTVGGSARSEVELG